MNQIKLSGETTEDKLKSAEKYLYHFSKKLGKKIIEKIPAIPISNFKSDLGPGDSILEYIIPFECRIDNVIILVSKKHLDSPVLDIIIDIINGNKTISNKISLNKNANDGEVSINTNIKKGSVINIYLDGCRAIKIGAALTIYSKNFSSRKHLINNS